MTSLPSDFLTSGPVAQFLGDLPFNPSLARLTLTCRALFHSRVAAGKRVAGLAALLDRRGPKGQKFESVTYADLDTVPVDFTVTPAHYLALASSADLIGSANAAGMPILMNSGLLIVRNTAWSRSVLLEAWWRRRAQGRRCSSSF